MHTFIQYSLLSKNTQKKFNFQQQQRQRQQQQKCKNVYLNSYYAE